MPAALLIILPEGTLVGFYFSDTLERQRGESSPARGTKGSSSRWGGGGRCRVGFEDGVVLSGERVGGVGERER